MKNDESVVAARDCSNSERLTLSQRIAWQSRFLEEVPGLEILIAAFEDVPRVFLFIKDLKSRFVYISPTFALRLGLSNPDEAILTCDHDYRPPEFCDRLVRDDLQIITNRKPLRNYREPLFQPFEKFGWAITSKWPVTNRSGEIIGLAGITRRETPVGDHGGDDSSLLSEPGIDRLTQYIVNHRDRILSNEEMARAYGLSVRQLVRRLHESHGLTPRHYATFTRIQLACKCLGETDQSILDIALDHGFSNQSFFTTQFKKFIGITPLKFRKEWRKQQILAVSEKNSFQC